MYVEYKKVKKRMIILNKVLRKLNRFGWGMIEKDDIFYALL